MDAGEIQRFIENVMPQGKPPFHIEHAADDGVRLRLPVGPMQLRPGGTVSGPTLMMLVDAAAWAVILSRAGPEALSVTTSLHIDFLRRPPMADMLADATLLKLGRRLAVAEVGVRTDGRQELVAKAQVTYSMPPAPAEPGDGRVATP